MLNGLVVHRSLEGAVDKGQCQAQDCSARFPCDFQQDPGSDIGLSFSSLQVVKRLPKTRSGKIMRRLLRKVVSEESSNMGDITTLDDPSVVREILDAYQKYKKEKSSSQQAASESVPSGNVESRITRQTAWFSLGVFCKTHFCCRGTMFSSPQSVLRCPELGVFCSLAPSGNFLLLLLGLRQSSH